MSAVTFANVRKRYGDGTLAVADLTLDIRDGEIMILLGPSGCGKSTALRMIAGIEQISGGELTIGGKRVNDLAPSERDVAMVFQNGALYPHLTVRQNLGFALEMAKFDKAEIRRRVEDAARVLELSPYLESKPKVLSGGERQRVAMGRAIVREPSVFLMDEPLSNLDANLRAQMRTSIVRLQQRLATTMVYVTHDQLEAMTMGDRVAVLRSGRLEQVAPPSELYERPANLFVAGFVGSPPMNLVTASLERDASGRCHACFGRHRLALDPAALAAHPRAPAYDGREIVLGLRAEHFQLGSRSGLPDDQRLRVAVEQVEALGSETHVHFDLEVAPVLVAADGAATAPDWAPAPLAEGTRFAARLDGLFRVPIAATVEFAVHTRFAYLFDPATGLPLR